VEAEKKVVARKVFMGGREEEQEKFSDDRISSFPSFVSSACSNLVARANPDGGHADWSSFKVTLHHSLSTGCSSLIKEIKSH
jgi:hypothetical protein